jgi:hypothetical protein
MKEGGVNSLIACETRDDAYKLLENLKKVELISLARQLFLYINPNYNKETIKIMIVETTVGRRLDYEAFKSTSLEQ